VRHGKGDKFRIVGIPESFCATIQIWIDKRRSLGINGSKPLFCTITTKSKGEKLLSPGGKMSTDCVRGFMSRVSKKIEKKTGNKLRVHSHGFRHTMTSELVSEGCNIIEVQEQLGHSNLNTTQKYIKKIAPEQLVGKMYNRKCTLEI
jgi:site-specific recombinase XerD